MGDQEGPVTAAMGAQADLADLLGDNVFEPQTGAATRSALVFLAGNSMTCAGEIRHFDSRTALEAPKPPRPETGSQTSRPRRP